MAHDQEVHIEKWGTLEGRPDFRFSVLLAYLMTIIFLVASNVAVRKR
jgi:hypothetical protein